MTNSYTELKYQHSEAMNAFPKSFAFSEDQFQDGLAKLGVTKDEIASIGGGGFIRKSDAKAFGDLILTHVKECDEAQKDPQYLYEMFLYELGNHEYCITYEIDDTLAACGMTEGELYDNPVMLAAMQKATSDYLAGCEELFNN